DARGWLRRTRRRLASASARERRTAIAGRAPIQMRCAPPRRAWRVLSIHRLTAGDGYTYLLKHVATGDVDRRMATPLTAYYAASGYPAGRWLGRGLSGLGDGQLAAGTEVTEEQIGALFGRARNASTGDGRGEPYR